jgi:LysM repeat protein
VAEERKLSLKRKPKGSNLKRTAFSVADQFVPATIVKRLVQGRASQTDKRRLRTFGIQAASNPFAAMATFGAGKDVERGTKQLKRGDLKRAGKNLGFAAATVVPLGGGVGKAAATASKVSKIAKQGSKTAKQVKGKRPTPGAPAGYPTKSAGMNPGRANKSGPEPKPRKEPKTSEARRADAFARRKESGKASSKPKTQRGTVAQGTRRYRSALDNKGRIAADKAIAKEFKGSYNPTVSADDAMRALRGPNPSAKALREARKSADEMGGRVRDFNAFRKRLATKYDRPMPKGGGKDVREEFVRTLAQRVDKRAAAKARSTASTSKTTRTAQAKGTKSAAKTAREKLTKSQESTIAKARNARRANTTGKPTQAQIDAFKESTRSIKEFIAKTPAATSKAAKPAKGKAPKTVKGKPESGGKSLVLVPGKGRVLKETTGRKSASASGKQLVLRKKAPASGKELVLRKKSPAKNAIAKNEPKKPVVGTLDQKRLRRKIGATAVGSTALALVAQNQINKQNKSATTPTGSENSKRPGSRPERKPLPQPKKGGRRGYTVQGGDSLSAIAKKHGVSLDELLAANKGRLTKSTPLYRGTLVRLPKKSSDPAATGVAGKKRSEGQKPGRAIQFRKTGKISAGRAGKPRGRGKLRNN